MINSVNGIYPIIHFKPIEFFDGHGNIDSMICHTFIQVYILTSECNRPFFFLVDILFFPRIADIMGDPRSRPFTFRAW